MSLDARPAGRVRAHELDSLAEVAAAARTCELCRLCRERTQVVTGAGREDADVVVVTEAPGYHEDRTGRLVDGRAGELLDDVLGHAGLQRSDVYLTSFVRCRPPTGRTPFPDEVEACEGWLFREIALVQPRVVVTLGALALRLVTGRPERLADVRGQLIHAHLQGRDVVVWPLYHPAAALHVPRLVEHLLDDARRLGQLLRGARAQGARPAVAPDPAAVEPAPVPGSSDPAAGADALPSNDDGEPQLALDLA